ncbi:MAG: hypothetical protein ABSF27_06385, partial [Candidatus Dormibacteria bacterium]
KTHHKKKQTIEAAWCSLKYGQPIRDAKAKLGKPNTTASEQALFGAPDGLPGEAWNLKPGRLGLDPVLVITIQGGRIAELLAYGNFPLGVAPPKGVFGCSAQRIG